MKKTISLSIFLFFSFLSTANAAVVRDSFFDDVTSDYYDYALSHNITIAANSNRVLICSGYNGDGDTTTSITYNSISMYQLFKHAMNNGAEQYFYYLFNPTSGTHTVTQTRSTGGGGRMRLSCVWYSGVYQDIFDDTQSEYIYGDAPLSITLTPDLYSSDFPVVTSYAQDGFDHVSTNASRITSTSLVNIFESASPPISSSFTLDYYANSATYDINLFGVLLIPDTYIPPTPTPTPTPTGTPYIPPALPVATTTPLFMLYTGIGLFLIQLFAILTIFFLMFMLIGFPIKRLVRRMRQIIKRAEH